MKFNSAIFMPPEWNSGAFSFCPVCDCLSVTLLPKNFNFCHNFLTVKDRDMTLLPKIANFQRACTLVEKSYCYTPDVGVRWFSQ